MTISRLSKIILFLIVTVAFPARNNCAENIFNKIFTNSEHKESVNKNDIKVPEGLYDLSLDENLNILPAGKYSEGVRQHQKNQALALMKLGYNVEIMRNGEIIIVSIPSDELFVSLENRLTDNASEKLNIFTKFAGTPDLYRIMLAMHTDNTGSEEYKQNITQQRVNTVFDWFKSNIVNSDYIIPYAMSDTNPVVENNSYKNRRKNRRLEIYLVPGKKMLDAVKHKQKKYLKIIK